MRGLMLLITEKAQVQADDRQASDRAQSYAIDELAAQCGQWEILAVKGAAPLQCSLLALHQQHKGFR
jgi:hypothetical protein